MIRRFLKQFITARRYAVDRRKVILNSNVNISVKDISFEGFAHLEGGRLIGNGKITIGDNVIIGPGLQILTEVHDYESDMLPYNGRENIVKDVRIGRNVWIGADVTVMPGVVIGEGAVVGTKSFVNKDIPPLAVVAGTPAKVIKYRNKAQYDKLVSDGKLYLHVK